MSLRLLSYNIRFGGAGREQMLSAVIQACSPDIVILQEATRPEIVKRLANDCGMPQWGARLGHSLAWMSRIEVSGSAWHKVWFAKRSYLELAAGGLRVFGVHLAAIHSNVTERRRLWEARALLAGIAPAGFHVLTGDFNSLAPGEILDLARLPGRLRAIAWATGGAVRWQTIRHVLDAGYVDGYRLFHDDPGYTFPTWDPRLRLDYCFLPAAERERLESCEVMSGAAHSREASDHLPLLSVIASPV